MTETQTRLEKIRNDMELGRQLAKYDYDRVRSNSDLNESARLRRLEEVYEKAKAKHEKLRQAAGEERGRTKTEARQRLYSPPIPQRAHGAERETFLMSLRDAADRAQRAVTDPKKPREALEKLYQQAALADDKMLKHAIFVQGLGYGLRGGFVDEYLDEQGLWDALEALNQDTYGRELFDRACSIELLTPRRRRSS